jgi:drug/metabolite transporter (DMT)-like permease
MKKQTSLDLKSIITLSLVSVAWSASFVFIKIGLAEIPPVTLAFIRFAVAFPIMVMATLVKGANRGVKIQFKKDFVSFSILALTGVTFIYIFQFYSLKYTSASIGSILINTTVIFMAVLSAAFLSEKLGPRKIMGIIIAFTGLFVVISNFRLDFLTLNHQELFGDALMIVSALLWAVYSIYSQKILQRHSALLVTTVVFGLGAFYLIPFTLLELPSISIGQITWVGWTSVLYLSLICSAFAYLAWNRAISRVETVKAGMFLYFIPVLTSILSYFILGEEITAATFIGGILVLIGVYLTESA